MITPVAKLNKNDVADILALTPMQEGMLLQYLKDPQSEYYFEQLGLKFNSFFDFECIKEAWNLVVQQNELLRTVYRWDEVRNPMQVILKQHPVDIAFYDLTDEADQEKAIDKLKSEDRKNKFNLLEVPFRLSVCLLSEKDWLLIISNHHIIYDGWSNGLILKEFIQAYGSLLNGVNPELLVKNKFKEFIKWQQNQDKKRAEIFWKEYLEDYCYKRIPSFTDVLLQNAPESFLNHDFKLTKTLGEEIDIFLKKHKITFATLIYTSWGILLQRYCNSTDIVFGTAVSGRNPQIAGIENMVGLFINILPLRFKTDGSERLITVLEKMNEIFQEMEPVESTALSDIKKYIGIKNELFDSLVIIENYPLSASLTNTHGIKIDSYSMFEQTDYPLTVSVTSFDDMEIVISYKENVFGKTMIKRMAEHFQNIIREVVRKPESKPSEIEMLSNQEKEQLLQEFGGTSVEFSNPETINAWFELQVEQVPDRVALVFKGERLTYRELNAKANQLAALLRQRGSGPELIVAILAERSLHMVIGILAVLKSGAAYLPIDPGAPKNRITYLLKDSKAEILLTQTKLLKQVPDFQGELLILDDPSVYSGDTANLRNINHPKDLAYIIYTSGTTGKPKGAMIEHRNVVNYISWFGQTIPMRASINYLMLMDYTFDPSIADIFGSLLYGATLHVFEKNLIYDREAFIKYVRENDINVIDAVPAILKELISTEQKLPSLHTILVGSEALDNHLKNLVIDKGYTLFNHYGLTETTVDVSVLKCSEDPVTIGKPIANVRCYVLDRDLNLMPVGIPGELCVGGAGVGRGYLNLDKLNTSKFIQDPYSKGKMYRTGDLIRWLPDGQLEFIGRIDNQINVRGFRVEPEEIQEVLLGLDGIKDAAVITKDNRNKGIYLIAFFAAENAIKEESVKEFLASQLPAYMVPSRCIQLDKIPQTASGKKNHLALSVIANSWEKTVAKTFVAPQTGLEETIADIWKDLLKLDKVGVNENFFDIGGNSLYIIRLNSRLKSVLQREIPVVALFDYPTISSFIGYLSEKEAPVFADPDLQGKLDKSKKRLNQRRETLKNSM